MAFSEMEFPAPATYRVPISLAFRVRLSYHHHTDKVSLRTLFLSDTHIKETFTLFPRGKSNRMVDRYGASNFVMVEFSYKMKPVDIVAILSKGIWIDEEEFQFIGCSSSGLKKRTCYMMKGASCRIRTVRDSECMKLPSPPPSIPKQLKGIGLLFSTAIPTNVEVTKEHVLIETDILTRDGKYNFTDGCGAVGRMLHSKIVEEAKLRNMLPEGYEPCVLQIRYRGCKGIVVLDHEMEPNTILIRKSMEKFESGEKPFPKVWICNYSKPYSMGYLNKQFIMLLSGLGVPREVFLKKQRDYYNQMRLLRENLETGFEQLCMSGNPELAARVITGKLMDKRVQEELGNIQRKFIEKLSKLKILIRDSRNVFGICDTSRELDYGECFFQPTIDGFPHTISGKVIVAKNPSYFLGDMRVLTAIDGPRVEKLKHLVDCIVFPTKGKRPHPDEITGSDLDGDEYFVCWDAEFSIEKLVIPTDYSVLASAGANRHQWRSHIHYFANQVKIMGLLNSHYLYWAETKGVNSEECRELGKLFSRSVDASKTGDRLTIPPQLAPPRDKLAVAQHPNVAPVWKEMELVAQTVQKEMSQMVMSNSDDITALSEDFIRIILLNKDRKELAEFDLFNILKKWCFNVSADEEATKKKLNELSQFINFGKFNLKQKLSAIDSGIPIASVTNALNSSQLLTTKMMQAFSLQDPHNRWCFYLRSTSAEFDWEDLLNAITTKKALIIWKLCEGATFVLHFLTKFEVGERVVPTGAIISYFFSPSLSRRHILGSTYSIDLNPEFLQLYRNSKKQETLVWIRNKIVSLNHPSESDFDRVSVDLLTFQKDIFRKNGHPKVKKQQIIMVEVYISSDMENPTYYDRLVSDLACSNQTSLEEDHKIEVIPRDTEKEELVQPNTKISLSKCLEFYSRHGDAKHFSDILHSTLTSDENIAEDIPLAAFIDGFLVLLTSIAVKYAHLCDIPAECIDCLIAVISSLKSQMLISPQRWFSILHKVSLLHCTELTEQVKEIIISHLQTNPMSCCQYTEVLMHWEWWYFLPAHLASSLAEMIYKFCLKQCVLVTSPPTATTPPSPQTPDELESYVCYYSYLFHRSYLEEIASASNVNNRRVSMLKVYDIKDPHQQSQTHQMRIDDSYVTGSKKKIGFHKSEGILSRFEGCVAISFMTGIQSESIPVTYGSIVEVSKHPTNVVVAVREPFPDCIGRSIKSKYGHWELTSVGNLVSFVRGMKALGSLAKNRLEATCLVPILVDPRGLYGKHSIPVTSDDHGTTSCQCPTLEPSPLNVNRDSLNEKQKKAVSASLAQPLTLIHGPPGTGKTKVACEIVSHKIKHTSPGAKILVTAETNMAVDNLTRQLVEQGVNVVRMGSRDQVSSEIFSTVSLESMVRERRYATCSLDNKRGDIYIDRKIATEVLRDVDVIATTCTGAGDDLLRNFSFPFVIIDEATQVKEPTSLIALTKHCEQLTLIGDPQQLAPYHIKSQISDQDPNNLLLIDRLAVTMFHRLQSLVPSVLLEEQYRMNSKLVQFPSQKFYGGKLFSSSLIEDRHPHFELDSEHPICFVDVYNSKEQHIATSFRNENEVSVVVKVVDHLINCNVSPHEITVLAPYKEQVKCLIEKLSVEFREVEATTIDNFQGRENDIIVFSTVRSNLRGELDFIASETRMNVLLTRARHCVVGVGNMSTLQEIELWKDWLDQTSIVSSDHIERLCVYNSNSRSGGKKERQLHSHAKSSSTTKPQSQVATNHGDPSSSDVSKCANSPSRSREGLNKYQSRKEHDKYKYRDDRQSSLYYSRGGYTVGADHGNRTYGACGGRSRGGGGDRAHGGGNTRGGGGYTHGGDRTRGGGGGGDRTRGGGDHTRGGGGNTRGGGDRTRGGGDRTRGGGDYTRGGGDRTRGGSDRTRGGGDRTRGGGEHTRGGDCTRGGDRTHGGGNTRGDGGGNTRGDGGDRTRSGGDCTRGGGDCTRGGGDRTRGGDRTHGGGNTRGDGDRTRGGGDRTRGGGDRTRGGGDCTHGGGNTRGDGGDRKHCDGGSSTHGDSHTHGGDHTDGNVCQ